LVRLAFTRILLSGLAFGAAQATTCAWGLPGGHCTWIGIMHNSLRLNLSLPVMDADGKAG